MAHTKTGASVKGSRNSIAKRLGVKKYAGEKVIPGNIIVRQRGTQIKAGIGVSTGKDYTLFAIAQGKVYFNKKRGDTFVNIQ